MIIIGIQIAACLTIFAALAFWYKPDPRARSRWGVWFTSRVVAGSCFGKAILLTYAAPVQITGSTIFETLIIVSFAVLICLAHGDMAKLFPRQVWNHR